MLCSGKKNPSICSKNRNNSCCSAYKKQIYTFLPTVFAPPFPSFSNVFEQL